MDTVSERKTRTPALAVCFLLALMVWAVFGQTLRHEFVNYDDPEYVFDNPVISKGVTLEGLGWAVTETHGANWHPLTSLSHMLDVEMYGLHPGGHHRTNVLLHMATALALFLVLRSMTGSLWRSAFVAAVFAIHPLRAESVAWVSERKDVLSGLFFMLTLGAYARYARFRASSSRLPVWSYLAILLFFALGLMSKPMLVTLPFLLLVLDFWPLERLSVDKFRMSDFKLLLIEKIPLFLLSAAFCGVTVWAQEGARMPGEILSAPWRLGNAAISYIVYIRQTVCPAGLAVFYPHRYENLPLWQVTASLILLTVISLAVWILRKRRPFLLAGWLWYAGMLVPIIGIVQVGQQAHADRYTYLPQIGLIFMLTWLAADLSSRWKHCRRLLGATATALLAALIAGAWIQTSHWRDSQSLWEHALAHTEDNYEAHESLGALLADQGEIEAGVEHCRQALRIRPNDAKSRYNLGTILLGQRLFGEAIQHVEQALRISPDYADAKNNLAWILATCPDAALRDGPRAVELAQSANRRSDGSSASYLDTLAAAYAEAGRYPEAIETARLALDAAAAQRTAANGIRKRLRLYEAERPYHESKKEHRDAQ